jgi:hypothetical protein
MDDQDLPRPSDRRHGIEVLDRIVRQLPGQRGVDGEGRRSEQDRKPSRGALATTSVPTMPLAPGRFSTTTG